jgi:hypothetical protein
VEAKRPVSEHRKRMQDDAAKAVVGEFFHAPSIPRACFGRDSP